MVLSVVLRREDLDSQGCQTDSKPVYIYNFALTEKGVRCHPTFQL